jgi:hypothetical protein
LPPQKPNKIDDDFHPRSKPRASGVAARRWPGGGLPLCRRHGQNQKFQSSKRPIKEITWGVFGISPKE